MRLALEAALDRQISRLSTFDSEQVRVISKTKEIQDAQQRDRSIPG
jgi:hypothetical protein